MSPWSTKAARFWRANACSTMPLAGRRCWSCSSSTVTRHKTSFPGLADLTGARVLAEIGDDRDRFACARALKAYAGSAPITRASGKSIAVHHRKVKNQRLAAVGYVWAFAALRNTGTTTIGAMSVTGTPACSATPSTACSAACFTACKPASFTTNQQPLNPASPGRPGARASGALGIVAVGLGS
jgi:hypothetical protein